MELNNKKFLTVSIILIASIFIIPLMLYWLFVGIPSTGISSNPTKWSEFGSYLSGIFGSISAIITCVTLFFIIDQHKQNIKNQQLNTKIQQRNIEIQQESIEEQRKESKLRLKEFHKQDFIELLSQLESQGDNLFYFKNKLSLYHSIFNRRDFDIFSEHYDSAILNKANDYFLSMKYYNDNIDSITNDFYPPKDGNYNKLSVTRHEYIKLLESTLNLNSTLGVVFNENDHDGNLLFRGMFIGLNAHQPRFYFEKLANTLNEINFFVSRKDLITEQLHINGDLSYIMRGLGYYLKKHDLKQITPSHFQYKSNDLLAEMMYEFMSIHEEYLTETKIDGEPQLILPIWFDINNYFFHKINDEAVNQKEYRDRLIKSMKFELTSMNNKNLSSSLNEKINKITSDLDDYKSDSYR
ncbi:hypothetical protein BF17_07235 [Yersinia similis]|uniref:Phage abortive infection protein n=1 Tax=Yersinia similis TaxID=367190 RepID=A0ABN4CT23_9GAMM|nr:hypothetical protein [Yersinia similis]AHK21945.1 hypothetical protein BF17_07235 [Yersinia similis]CFQ64344.1 Uncharacterised protein [Yersinia similis]